MKQVYNENSIKTLNYREAARQSLGMYIGSNDINGMHHLLTEIVANSMDEAAAGYGKKITVQIERSDNRAYVMDEGRGIPFKKNADGKWAIIEMCTNMHSGGKFSGQGNYKSSLGLNGVGATVTNALSSQFEISVRRDGYRCIFGVYDGEYDDEPVIEPYSGKDTGTIVSFIPDTEIFGDLTWDINKIKEELQLHALLNNGITFEVLETEDDYNILSRASYKYQNGIKDMLKLKRLNFKKIYFPYKHLDFSGFFIVKNIFTPHTNDSFLYFFLIRFYSIRYQKRYTKPNFNIGKNLKSDSLSFPSRVARATSLSRIGIVIGFQIPVSLLYIYSCSCGMFRCNFAARFVKTTPASKIKEKPQDKPISKPVPKYGP